MFNTNAATLKVMFSRLRPIWLSSTDDGAPMASAMAPTARINTTVRPSTNSPPNTPSTASGTAITPARMGNESREHHSTTERYRSLTPSRSPSSQCEATRAAIDAVSGVMQNVAISTTLAAT